MPHPFGQPSVSSGDRGHVHGLTRSCEHAPGGMAVWGLWHTCLALAGQGATSLGFGAAPRASAASATFPWLIHAPRLFGGAGVPLNHRQARIHRNNRRVPPPDVTPVMPCDDRDERGQAEAVTPSSPPLSSAAGQAECWRSWRGPLYWGLCAPSPERPRSPSGVRVPQAPPSAMPGT